MFKSVKPKKATPFCTYDIETAPNGELLVIGLYHPSDKVRHFYTWGELFKFLGFNNFRPEYRMLFAHNAGNFDAVSLIHWLLLENPDFDQDKCKIITTGSTVVFLQYSDFNEPVMFGDTALTLKTSLHKLCEIFEPDVPKLSEFPIEMITQYFYYDPDIVLKYLDADCISLYQIMEKFMDLLHIDFFPLTIASLSMYVFRLEYLKDHQIYKPTKKQDDFITQAYAGGRVECFKQGYHDQVYTFDINSLYPYIMSNAQIPVNTPPVKTRDYIDGMQGFYHIKYNQYNTDQPAVLWTKSLTQGLVFNYQGEGVYSSIEIELAKKIGTDIEIIEGVYFPETEIVFKEFVDYHYNARLEYKKIEKNTGIKQPMQLILKFILNSQYGKYAQREESKHLEIMTEWEQERYMQMVIVNNKEQTIKHIADLKDDETPLMVPSTDLDGKPIEINGEPLTEPLCPNKLKWYNEDKGLMEVTTKRNIDYRIIYISAIITAMARVELYSYLTKYKDVLVYCDTDSVHLTKNICMNQGDALGQMKPEEQGPGIHLGRKMYGILDSKPKIKYKGITNNCKLGGDSLEFNDLKTILKQSWETEQDSDQVYKFSFNTFPKLKTCLQRRAKPAKKVRITKELKKPEYTTNFKG